MRLSCSTSATMRWCGRNNSRGHSSASCRAEFRRQQGSGCRAEYLRSLHDCFGPCSCVYNSVCCNVRTRIPILDELGIRFSADGDTQSQDSTSHGVCDLGSGILHCCLQLPVEPMGAIQFFGSSSDIAVVSAARACDLRRRIELSAFDQVGTFCRFSGVHCLGARKLDILCEPVGEHFLGSVFVFVLVYERFLGLFPIGQLTRRLIAAS